MVEYKCERCQTIFTKKSNYERHINRKNECDGKVKNNECEYCGNCYSRKDSLKRHYTTCEKKEANQININKSKINMDKSKINGRDENTNIDKKIIDSVINNINGNENGSINVDNRKIILLNFPPSETNVMEVLDKILASDENINIAIIKNVNFNKEKPENHNIYYPDIKSSYGEVYTDDRWNNKKIDEILNLLLLNNSENLNKIFKKLGNFLNDETKEKIQAGISDFYNGDIRKKIKSYLKAILFDGRDAVKKTKKEVASNLIINTEYEIKNNAICDEKKGSCAIFTQKDDH